ncbi:hypothetical protein DENSPDRAFT_862187 [Dentipellis sp. KUC8613]|nr:hypothetical protein DENSPDRAFT_862187 [Dentipellis sp. KUC8613]
MNKNPFAPQPSYNPPQPPLPPGPPPPQPSQPDYSAYWAAAAAAQSHATPSYNAQWPGSAAPAPAAPARPPAEQSNLYANYGYGGQQSFQWQAQQQQQRAPQIQFQPPQPQPPPPQQYNPYQPQQAAAFAQPYVPQAGPTPLPPPPIVQQPYAPPQHQQQQQRQFFPPPQRHNQPHQPQHQQHQQFAHGVHHTPPQHLPPAKRIKYEASGPHARPPPQQVPPPPQPQFQPPPPPPGPMGQQSQMGGGFGAGRPNGQGGSMPRGGGPGGRGGGGAGRGRGGNMGNNRGGSGRGRGGSMYNSSGRGGGQGGQQLKGHGSRGNFGGNRDYGNRRGGSFSGGGSGGVSGGGHGHQQGAGGSYRGRGQGPNYGSNYTRGGRHESGGTFGSRDGVMSSSFVSTTSSSGKKDENRRTLTDFKIVGLEVRELDWSWGVLPSAEVPAKDEPTDAEHVPPMASPQNEDETSNAEPAQGPVEAPATSTDSAPSQPAKQESDDAVPIKGEPSTAGDTTEPSTPAPSSVPTTKALSDMPAPSPPPSRIRIYFHTPVTPDDSHPIPHGTGSFNLASSSDAGTRKGKRKKLEDDDGDIEERRAPPPPPGGQHERAMSVEGVDRDSVAPSVAETTSEGDWLMAAIGEDEGDEADGEGDLHVSEVDPQADGDGSGYVAETEDGNIGGTGSDHDHDHVDEGESGLSNHDSVPEDPPGLGDGQLLDDAHSALAASREAGAKGSSDAPSGSTGAGGAVQELNGHGSVAIPHPEQQSPEPPGVAVVVQEQSDVAVKPAAEPAPSAVSLDVPIVAVSDASDSTVASSHASADSVIAPPEPTVTAAEQSADSVSSPDAQVPPSTQPDSITSSADGGDLPLTQEISFGDVRSSTLNDDTAYDSATQVETQIDELASPEATTLISGSSISTYGELNQLPLKADPHPGLPTPSANRLSISYAGGTKRLVINAEVVESLKVFRAEGRIEVRMTLEKEETNGLNGVLIESLSEATKSYTPLETLSAAVESDSTVPPFSKATLPCKVILLVHLDTERPLSEPKWVKSGDVQEWLKSMFGRMFWVAGDAAEGWEKKIEVVDPDPAPTIWTVLEGWSVNSPVGTLTERQRFLRTHMTESDNILEILLRLVRGERATPFSQSSPAISAPSISGPLLSALSQGSAHGAQQTHVSLAVLAMVRMAVEYAKRAVGEEKGKSEVEERVGEIIRCLPSHLLYKSLDGIFKEWKVEKKGGR